MAFLNLFFYDFSVAEQGMEAWKRYIRRDDSKLVDIFVGQLKVQMVEMGQGRRETETERERQKDLKFTDFDCLAKLYYNYIQSDYIF